MTRPSRMRPVSISFLAYVLVGAPASSQVPAPRCVAPDAEVALDHVVVGVLELEMASQTYARLGFTQKVGRLHGNGLENRLIEFGDGSELELMAVVNEPRDAIAQEYARFLSNGEGGAFLALSGSQERVLAAAADVGVAAAAFDSGVFRYVTFEASGLAAVFVVEYGGGAADPDSLVQHRNGAVGIDAVWIEASPGLGHLLSKLGAVDCGRSVGLDGRTGTQYGVGGGSVVVLEAPTARPRVVGVSMRRLEGSDVSRYSPEDTHGIWLEVGVERPPPRP